MRLRRILLPVLPVLLLGTAHAARAQSPTYGLGKAPTDDEIRAWDIAISPSGKELPQGHGTAAEGADIYSRKCAACHGAVGYGGRAPALIKGSKATLAGVDMKAGDVMATHAPYATQMWDYINRAMPLYQEGTLKPDEVYSLTAFLLSKSEVIQEGEVMDQQTLPQVKMPNREGYNDVPDYRRGQARIFPNH